MGCGGSKVLGAAVLLGLYLLAELSIGPTSPGKKGAIVGAAGGMEGPAGAPR